MKINMSIFNVMETLQTLNKFADVTGKLGYAIAKTKSRMVNEVQIFDEERDKLIKKYGEKNEEGNYYIPQESKNAKVFIDEITSIGSENVEIDFKQVTREEFDKADIFNEQCSTKDYELLELLFVENEKLKEAQKTNEAG